MTMMNFDTEREPVTLYGRTITFKARTISGATYFVPRHITYDVAGYWNVTLNNKVSQVTAGDDLHYSLNVAWKELKRRMSEELPSKRKQPRAWKRESPAKRVDTGLPGVVINLHHGRIQVGETQTIDGRSRRRVVSAVPVHELTQSWLSDTLYKAALIRQRYEELVEARQLRERVTLADLPDNYTLRRPLKRVTVQQVLTELGENREVIDTSSGDQKVAPAWAKQGGPINSEAKVRIQLERTPKQTIGQWLLTRLTRLAQRFVAWADRRMPLDE